MKIVFIQILVFLSLHSIAQIDILNLSLTDSSKSILYIGIDNKIKLNVKDVNKKMNLKTINCDILNYIFQNEVNTFLLRPKQQGNDTLYLYIGDKCIFKKEFKIERIGDVKCIIGKNLSYKLKKESIIENPLLNLFIPNCYLKINYQISSFEVYKKIGGEKILLYDTTSRLIRDTIYSVDIMGKESINICTSNGITTRNLGNNINNYQIEEIRKLKKGDFLHFESIKVNCSDGITRKIQNFEIEIM